MQPDRVVTETDNLITLVMRYLAVCNRALAESHDKFPYRHIWEAAARAPRPQVRLHISGERESGDYLLMFNGREHFYVMATPYVDGMTDGNDVVWNLPSDYLQQVVASPEEYVTHPARLNWDWLQACQMQA